MKKVDFKTLNSANITVDNSVDEAKAYDISAKANLSENKLASVDSGVVMSEGNVIATFTMHSNSLTPSFQNLKDPAEMCNILMAISSFIGELKNEVETNPIVL